MEIDALEHASRATMVWSPEVRSVNLRFGAVLSALVGMFAAMAASVFAAF
jgi:NAD dependent epimerase/dehydratase family enzyme